MKIRKISNRILAYTLTLAILLSSLVFGAVSVTAEETEIDVWDGTTAESFAGGDGSAATPYLIETAEQLRYLLENYTKTGESKDKFFKITKDIYLNDISNVNDPVDLWGKQNWLAGYGETVPVPANNVNLFEGTLDGDGHTIYGLYVNGVAYAGLFPAVSSYATIKNLSLEKVFITGGSGSAGAIAGWAEYTSWQSATQITNCSVIDATIGQAANIEFVGGLVGRIDTTTVTVTNCSAYGLTLSQDTGRGIAGGLIGFAQTDGTLKINNSFSVGYFATCSQITKAICTNVYTTADIPEGYTNGGVTKLNTDQMKGDAAKDNMTGFDFKYTWKTVTNGYPVFSGIKFWDGTTDTSFLEKNAGTADDPYIIETAAQLRGMVDHSVAYDDVKSITDPISTKRPHYKIVNDIYLNPVTEEDMAAARASAVDGVNDGVAAWDTKGFKKWRGDWSQKSGFYGEVDGGGHTVYGVYSKSDYAGLINDTVGNTVIKNLHVKDSYFYGKVVGGITAQPYGANSTLTIIGCSVDNTAIEGAIKETNYTGSVRVGGIVGGADTTVKKIAVSYCSVTNMTFETYNTTYPGIESAFIGYVGGSGSHNVSNCYSDNTVHPVCNVTNTQAKFNTIADRVAYKNVYTTYPETFAEAGVKTVADMKGEAAKTNMLGFNFDNAWKTVNGGYPVLRDNAQLVWGGGYDLGFKGQGTAEAPYLVESPEQLAYIVSVKGVAYQKYYFKVVNDININDTTKADWKNNAFNWVWADVRFQGTFDGDGHTINGLYLSGSQKRFALFPYVGDTLIKNLKFSNAYIYDTFPTTSDNDDDQGMGILCAQASAKADFDTIYIDETCYLEAPYIKGVAGIVGRSAYNINITNSAVLGTIKGESHVGAFYGTHWSGTQTVNNSFSASNVPIMPSRALATSANNYATVVNETYESGAVTLLTEDQMKSENAKTNMLGFDFYGLWKTTDSYPVLRDMNDRMESWDGTKAESFAGGNGTIDNPYQIANGAQLYKMVSEYSNADVTVAPETQTYFRITADINLGGKQWYTITPKVWLDKTDYNTIGFNGVVYGEGHKVYNLCNNVAAGAVGLIPVATQGAEIHDLHLIGGRLPRANYQTYAVGGLVGMAKAVERSQPMLIEGCSVTDITIAAVNGAGGLVGYDYSQSIIIKDSYVSDAAISVTAESNANPGAFIGYIDGSEVGNSFVIENSYCVEENPTILCRKTVIEEAVSFKNVYTTNETYDGSVEGLIKLSDEQMKAKLGGFNYNQVWQTTDNGYSVQRDFAVQKELFTGTAALEYAGGNGTEDDPYLISNADQLYKLANASREETLGKFYKLTNNIAISRTYDGWTNDNPYTWAVKKAYLEGFTYASSFAGTLDGAGYTVGGIYYNNEITDNGDYAYGLIPFATANAVVKDITVSDINATVTGNGAAVGGVVGAAHVTPEDAENPFNFIQFVGVNVKNCSANAAYTGDIVGRATHGIKFEICNADSIIGNYTDNIFMNGCNEALTLGDNVVIYNALNADSKALEVIRAKLIGTTDAYITDINATYGFDIADLVSAYRNIVAAAEDEYELVWSQDFNNNTMDYSVWSQNTTMSRKTNLVYGDNATVTGGSLKLNNKDTGEVDENGNKIYSVSYGLSTVDTMSFKYGRLEMRAKIPFGAGAFPSLWLTSRNALGNGVSPYGYDNEIDIFEVFGKSTSQDRMITCMHKWYVDENGNRIKDAEGNSIECSNGTGKLSGNGSKIDEADRSHIVTEAGKTAWHTIVFEWTEDTMTFTVDGESYDIKLSQLGDFDLTGYDTDSEGLFNQFMYLRLNNHMYTVGGSTYVYDGSESDIDPNKLTYEIDYIKLYQKDNGEINLK